MTVLTARPAGEIAEPDGLPEGWALTTLGETCELNPPKPGRGLLPPDVPVTFVPMPSVDATSGTIAAPLERRFGEIRNGYTAFREGDVIFAKITPCMENGKAAIARGLTHGLGFGSTEFHVLRPTEAALPEYVHHFVRQESFRRAAEARMTGSVGQRRVPMEYLASASLPLPPLSEQQRIVAQVEALLARTSPARERLAKVPAILKRFRQSVWDAAATGRLTADWRTTGADESSAHRLLKQIKESHAAALTGHGGKAADPSEDVHTLSAADLPGEWALTELMWLCEPGKPITYGILKPGPDVADGVPYVRVADFPGDRLLLSGIRRTSREIATQYRRSSLRGGDVLLSIRGTVGRVCTVPESLSGANITQDTARITPHPLMSGAYVQVYLRSPSIQGRLRQATRGVAVRGVNIGDVRVLQVPVPPRPEQDEIVRRMEALFALADTVERRVQAATARADALMQSILARAFRGELVPTEAELARKERRDYEPATVLLERVRVSRADAPRAAKRGRRSAARQMRLPETEPSSAPALNGRTIVSSAPR